ncbi:MAG: AAA family ATPase [Candidatus Eremiobacteraeota bacterium]|nr:AAA family ATPase [Candidatus Eremiobacteraeota bacterium]
MVVSSLQSAALVGRQSELDALVELGRQSGRGHGSLVFVSGDAGIGKTRLLRAFRDTLNNRRSSIALATYSEFANAPYAVLLEALAGLGDKAPMPTEATRAEQFASLRERFVRTVERRSAVVILEDLQWADEASLQFLLYLVQIITSTRLLVVASYRSDELHRTHPNLPYVARLQRDPAVRRIALESLSSQDVTRLMRALLAGREQLARHALERVAERAEGNPFMIEELLKNALERLADPVGDDLPLAVRSAVAERLALLDADAREVLLHAAIVGPQFEAAFLARICRAPVDDVLRALRIARDLQLVVEQPSNPPSYHFRHALTREAVYAEMLAGEVRPVHGRIAAAFEERDPDAHLAEIAYHYWAARDAEKAERYNELAGDRAAQLHAYADALRSYERAMELVSDGETAARLFAKAARACADDGDADRASRLFQSAAGAMANAGRTDGVAELAYRASSEAYVAGQIDRCMTIARDALAKRADGDTDPAWQKLALALCYGSLERGEYEAARELLSGVAPEAHRAEVGIMYYNAAAYEAAIRGDIDAMVEHAHEYERIARESGDDRAHLRASSNAGAWFSSVGLVEPARIRFDRALEGLRDRRIVGVLVVDAALFAIQCVRTGELEKARALIGEALSASQPFAVARLALGAAALVTGRVLCDDETIGRIAPAELFDEAMRVGIPAAIGRLAGPYAWWLADRGRQDEARAALAIALDRAHSPFAAFDTLLAAEQLGDEATRAKARALLDVAAGVDAPAYRATVAHALAIAALRNGDRDGAVRAADVARREYGACGWRYYSALAREVADPASALAEFRAMGALLDVRRLSLRAAPPRAAAERPVLSQREWEIARLVCDGASNKAIAANLFITEKTVEKYLTAMYEKFGFRKRSELAAYVARAD